MVPRSQTPCGLLRSDQGWTRRDASARRTHSVGSVLRGEPDRGPLVRAVLAFRCRSSRDAKEDTMKSRLSVCCIAIAIALALVVVGPAAAATKHVRKNLVA